MKFLKKRGKDGRKLSLKARLVRWLLKDVPLDALRVGDNTIDITSTQIDMGGGNITNVGTIGGFTAAGDIIPDADGVRRIGTPDYRFSGSFTGLEAYGQVLKGDLLPDADNARRIGTSTLRFSGAFTDLEFSRAYARGDIVPDADAQRSIGNPTYTFSGAFSDIFLKGRDNRIYSEADCYGFIGFKGTRRFSGVYASEVLTSDLMFSEQSCELCGRNFEPGDVVALIVKRIDEEGGGIRVIPVHVECKNAAS
ncbi:hypothetical protein DRO42_07915 [Candidatus Bathyarchaeota archaeon]|nr:MAG: hypothetical protein DRO42_07915 [Candidatus Bathyarchaeota archaeon]